MTQLVTQTRNAIHPSDLSQAVRNIFQQGNDTSFQKVCLKREGKHFKQMMFDFLASPWVTGLHARRSKSSSPHTLTDTPFSVAVLISLSHKSKHSLGKLSTHKVVIFDFLVKFKESVNDKTRMSRHESAELEQNQAMTFHFISNCWLQCLKNWSGASELDGLVLTAVSPSPSCFRFPACSDYSHVSHLCLIVSLLLFMVVQVSHMTPRDFLQC